jgi:hypothetical protein
VIRYNYIEQSAAGWDIDLVESQESYSKLGPKASCKESFVYLASAHELLCVLDHVPGNERIYSAKIFELMALGRPLLLGPASRKPRGAGGSGPAIRRLLGSFRRKRG